MPNIDEFVIEGDYTFWRKVGLHVAHLHTLFWHAYSGLGYMDAMCLDATKALSDLNDSLVQYPKGVSHFRFPPKLA
jgi:hypothetical protein